MSLLIGFLTFILVVTCIFLVLLVLVQLPKKEAGAGLAFGGGASDALFGAGSGSALTQMTKYVATLFLGLSLVLAVLNAQRHESTARTVQEELSRKSSAAAPMVTPPPATAPANTQQPQPLTLDPNAGSLTISTAAPTIAPNTSTAAPATTPPQGGAAQNPE